MSLGAKQLTPFFTMALMGCSAPQIRPPATAAPAAIPAAAPVPANDTPAALPPVQNKIPSPAEKYKITPQWAQPEIATGWRDAFLINATSPQVLRETEETMDRIFAVPEINDALLALLVRKREAAACIESGCDPIFNEEQKYEIARDVYTKTLISVTDDPITDSGITKPVTLIFYKDDVKSTFFIEADIEVTSNPQREYIGQDGGYHKNSLLTDLTHELVHFIYEDRQEQRTTDKTNTWLAAIDPAIPPRGSYFYSRAMADSVYCQNFNFEKIPTLIERAKKTLDNLDPEEKLPDMRDAQGKPLDTGGIATALMQLYVSPCR